MRVEKHGRMNWKGSALIAPESLLDDRGRRVMWAWACEGCNAAAQKAAGWSGVFTLPRILDLEADGSLRIEPAEELNRLRLNPKRGKQTVLARDTEIALPGVHGNTLELNFELDAKQASLFGIKLLASPDGGEHTTVSFDLGAKSVRIDLSRSSLSPDVFYPWPHPRSAHHPMGGPWNKEAVWEQTAPLDRREGENLNVRLFLDRSILEL
jgi:beta-fructofuranosidase